MKITVRALSELTGFSPATVSNALNNKPGVNRHTVEKILAVARNFGYFSESRIKNIKFAIFKNSGNIVSDTPFFSSLMEGVACESREAGFGLSFVNLDKHSPEYENIREQLIKDGNSAIILLATEMTEADIKPFAGCVSPIVVLDNWFESNTYDSVLISNTDSVFEAVQYLIEKGHREIGYLKGNIRIKNFFYREMGYARALNTSGLSNDPGFTVALTPTMDGAYEDMLIYLQQKPVLPTAFFADNDIIALGAMKALQACGIQIPDDVSMIGLDDLPFCTISSPALTTIRVHKEDMGRAAVRRLTELIGKPAQTRQKIQVCNTFIKRESVREIHEKYKNEKEKGEFI